MLEDFVLSAESVSHLEGIAVLFIGVPVIFFFVHYVYSRTYPYVAGRIFWLLVSLRSIVFFFLLCLLIEPILEVRKKLVRKPSVLMLIDTSPSMAVSDGNESRLDEIRNFFNSDLWVSKTKEFEFHSWAFSDTVYPVSIDTLHKLKVGGQSTKLGEALEHTVSNSAETGDIKGVLVVSDGIHNAGLNPLELAKDFLIPVFSLFPSSMSIHADLKIIEAEAQAINYSNQEAKIKVTVSGNGFAGQRSDLVVSEKGKEISRSPLEFTGQLQEVEISIPPSASGTHLYRIKIVPLEGEVTHLNNEIMTSLEVKKEKARVLLIGSRPNSDVAFLYRTLAGDSTLTVTSAIQKSAGELYTGKLDSVHFQSIDVFVLVGYDPQMWSSRMLSALEKEINNGKGLLWVAGSDGFHQASIALPSQFFPFEISNKSFLKEDVFLRISEDSFDHPIFVQGAISQGENWDEMAPLNGLFPITLSKKNAQVLIESTTGYPVFISGVYKRGKMIFALSQSFWSIDMKSRGLKASPGIVSLFWKSAVKWLGTHTNNNRLEVTAERPVYRAGMSVMFSGQFTEVDHELELKCIVGVKLDNGELVNLNLQMDGFYRGRWLKPPSGEYYYRPFATCGDNVIQGQKGRVVVDTYSVEWAELETNISLLENLTTPNGGSTFRLSAASEMFELWDFDHYVDTEINLFRLEKNSLTLCLIVILLFIEWWLRRRLGMV